MPAFGGSDTGGSALRPRELDAIPPEPPLKFAHSVGVVAHVSDLLDPAGNRDAYAGALQALGLSPAGHVALDQFGPPAPASPISRGGCSYSFVNWEMLSVRPDRGMLTPSH